MENDQKKTEDQQIKEAKSKILAGYVITYRLLGLNKDLAMKCMNELMIRKETGDDFEFENYIENNVKDTQKQYKPKNTLDLTTLQNMIKLSQK